MADKAITMFVDLRRWEEAKVFAASSGGSVDAKELTRRQAEWAEEAREKPLHSHEKIPLCIIRKYRDRLGISIRVVFVTIQFDWAIKIF